MVLTWFLTIPVYVIVPLYCVTFVLAGYLVSRTRVKNGLAIMAGSVAWVVIRLAEAAS